MVRQQFAPCATQMEAFERLRSIQFDPIAPAGCNHDLVLQARVPGYKIGDWEKTAYQDRLIYDGWDKQASLVPFEGWPLRRLFHIYHRRYFDRIFVDHPQAVEAILKDLEERGPLMPKECLFQERKAEWQGSWYGPNVAKQTLRALWGAGLVMTSGRRNGQHVYDLAERVVPGHLYASPPISEKDMARELILERHRAMGIVRPSAPYEVWSYHVLSDSKKEALAELTSTGSVVPVEVEGVKAHATPEFLSLLHEPSLEPRVVFVAPLDQLLWDRKMIAHVFGFDYVWEIYMPEAKRRWGYYVLPVLYGNDLVGRIEFWARDGLLEIRRWYFEDGEPGPEFLSSLEVALRNFMRYCSAKKIKVEKGVDRRIRDLAKGLKPGF